MICIVYCVYCILHLLANNNSTCFVVQIAILPPPPPPPQQYFALYLNGCASQVLFALANFSRFFPVRVGSIQLASSKQTLQTTVAANNCKRVSNAKDSLEQLGQKGTKTSGFWLKEEKQDKLMITSNFFNTHNRFSLKFKSIQRRRKIQQQQTEY